MTEGLIRYHGTGNFHFLTFSCFHRLPYLGEAVVRDLFEDSLERMRLRYRFVVAGYVVMPEHVHLLMSEPRVGDVARVIQALKLSVTRRRSERPFWQARYYDFTVRTSEKGPKAPWFDGVVGLCWYKSRSPSGITTKKQEQRQKRVLRFAQDDKVWRGDDRSR